MIWEPPQKYFSFNHNQYRIQTQVKLEISVAENRAETICIIDALSPISHEPLISYLLTHLKNTAGDSYNGPKIYMYVPS